LALRAGIVDGHIDAAKAGDGLIDEVTNVIVVTDVGADKDGICAEFAKFGFERFAFGFTAAGNDEMRAAVREGQCRGTADACKRTCNHNN
jgi:hypothetical protein